MISRQLIDLINSGRAASLAGSGISADAGIPTWPTLLELVADQLQNERRDTAAARALASSHRLPAAFEALAQMTSRSDIHSRVAAIVTGVSTPGRYHIQLADWPFQLYITTNYDHLIEDASHGRLVSVGNRGAELHKIAGGSSNFVWHLHGGCRLAADASDLIITKSDYDDYYPSSNLVDKLKAIGAAHQCVFVGFGFQDDDLNYVLKAIGRLGNSGLPHFAFIAYSGPNADRSAHQARLRSDYNVEAIPYQHGADHSDLRRVLASYEPFVVRHAIAAGRTPNTTPTYDPLASSLNVQSSLDIGMLANSGSLKTTLVGARIIAHIRATPGGQEDALERLYRSGSPSRDDILECVRLLRDSGAVTPPPTLDLTSEHSTTTEEAKARIALTRERFCASVRSRVSEGPAGLDEAAQLRVVDAGTAFLDRLCRERGLGVAQNLATSNVSEARRRTVSLIRHLPDYLVAGCRDDAEAHALVRLVADILTAPKEAETTFMGLLCQAYFGQHLVGASETLARVDLGLIADSCYVLDATVLVCLLAAGGKVHELTNSLIGELTNCGATLTTTRLFLEETAEHARWAADFVALHGEQSHQVIEAVQGWGGYRSNEFYRATS